MAKIIVHKVDSEDKTDKGTKFWKCLGTIDGELESFKVWDEPQLGVEFEGELKDNGKYGKSVSTGRSNRGGGGRRNERDPEVSNQIMRQNALTHAVEILTKTAQLRYDAEDDKEAGLAAAVKTLGSSNVIRLADVFFSYSAGKLSSGASVAANTQTQVPMTKEAVNAAFPEAVDQQDDPTPAKGQDVNPADIPF